MKMSLHTEKTASSSQEHIVWSLFNGGTFFAYLSEGRSLYICEHHSCGLIVETGCGQSWIASFSSLEMVVVKDDQGHLMTLPDADPIDLALNSKLQEMHFGGEVYDVLQSSDTI